MANQQPPGRPIILTIVDGWGLATNWSGNAIQFSETPTMHELWRAYPHAVLTPPLLTKQLGQTSSELSHAVLGSGRVLQSDLDDILSSIRSGDFMNNPSLTGAFARARETHKPLHLIGLLSSMSSHSHPEILKNLLALGQTYQLSHIYLHLMLENRSQNHDENIRLVAQLQQWINDYEVGEIATLIDRVDGMDASLDWSKTQTTYLLWTQGKGTVNRNPLQPLAPYQNRTESSHHYQAVYNLPNDPNALIHDGDIVLFWNARGDRLTQVAEAFLNPQALRPLFRRAGPIRTLDQCLFLVDPHIATPLPYGVVFPPAKLTGRLSELIAGQNRTQLRLAETEKQAHVTSFFSGNHTLLPGEKHHIISSPHGQFSLSKAKGTLKKIEMAVAEAIAAGAYDFILVNLASIDLASHTGDLFLTSQAVQLVDQTIGRLTKLILDANGTLLLTADHGTAEGLSSQPTHPKHLPHTANPVPFLFIRRDQEKDLVAQSIRQTLPAADELLNPTGTLADVAPTILELLEIPIPIEMSGSSLLHRLK